MLPRPTTGHRAGGTFAQRPLIRGERLSENRSGGKESSGFRNTTLKENSPGVRECSEVFSQSMRNVQPGEEQRRLGKPEAASTATVTEDLGQTVKRQEKVAHAWSACICRG